MINLETKMVVLFPAHARPRRIIAILPSTDKIISVDAESDGDPIVSVLSELTAYFEEHGMFIVEEQGMFIVEERGIFIVEERGYDQLRLHPLKPETGASGQNINGTIRQFWTMRSTGIKH